MRSTTCVAVQCARRGLRYYPSEQRKDRTRFLALSAMESFGMMLMEAAYRSYKAARREQTCQTSGYIAHGHEVQTRWKLETRTRTPGPPWRRLLPGPG